MTYIDRQTDNYETGSNNEYTEQPQQKIDAYIQYVSDKKKKVSG